MLCCMYICSTVERAQGCWFGARLGRLLDAGASAPVAADPYFTDHRHAHSTILYRDGVGREHALVIGAGCIEVQMLLARSP